MTAERPPWWATEFARLRPALLAFVGRRASFDPGGVSEYVDGAAVELAERLKKRGPFPAAWFGDSTPESDEVARFHGLVWQICRRRFYDGLRRYYAGRLERRREPSETAIEDVQDPAPDPESSAAARELLLALAARLDRLDLKQRELLARAADRGEDEPLTSSERMQLVRLRRKLGAQLHRDAGRRKG